MWLRSLANGSPYTLELTIMSARDMTRWHYSRWLCQVG